MTSTYTIHIAGLADVDRVERLWHSMVEHHREVAGAEWPVKTAADAWQVRRVQYVEWLSAGSGWLLLATPADDPGGDAVGYAVVRVDEPGATWALGAAVGELESLAVADRARGAGVGSALMAAGRDILRERGVEYWSVAVVEANADAVRLYERAGFRPYYRNLLGRVD